MAPSPELGQPKAPDKTDSKLDDKKSESAYKNNETVNRSSTSEAEENENFSTWGDIELKALLDEAITYKTPRDREHKSSIFKQLLENAELEDQKYENRRHHGSTRHHQGGSLQNLVESVHLEELYGNTKKQNHRHKYSSVSSRQKEGGSLPINVNVSLSSTCNSEQPPFMTDYQKKKNKLPKQQQQDSKEDNQIYDTKISHTVIDISEPEIIDSHHLNHESINQTLVDPMGGEDGSELSACPKIPRIHLSQAQIEISGDGTAKPAIGFKTQQNVDKFVPFGLIDNSSKNNVEKTTQLQLDSQYKAVKSIIDSKNDIQKTILMPGGKFLTSNIASHKLIDENGNSQFIPSTSQTNKSKSRKPKSDRNTIIVDYTKKEGFRGNEAISVLVRYIENEREKNKSKSNYNNGNNNNNNNSNNNNNNYYSGSVLNNSKKQKSNNNNNNNNKKEGKFKKCNSLEELSSCSKLKAIKEQQQQQQLNTPNNDADGNILRNKNNQVNKKNSDPSSAMQSNSTSSTTTTTISTNKKLSQQKRTERRSWGTEELCYLGENNNKLDHDNDVSNLLNDQQRKSNKLSNNNNNNNNKQNEQLLVPVVSNESISQLSNSNETAEFLLVTKKKKPKKKIDDLRNNHNNQNNNISNNKNHKNHGHNNNNNNNDDDHISYKNSNKIKSNNHANTSNFSNDRDLYLTSFNASDNNRRKSTSSVPPSERSDSPDIDSVHSLPIETLNNNSDKNNNSQHLSPNLVSNNNNNNNNTLIQNGFSQSQISYADIAKKSSSVVVDNSLKNYTNCSDKLSNSIQNEQCINPKNNTKVLHTNNHNGERSISTTKISGLSHSENKILHKSKSVENDSYNVSIDQYPALEKTVKNKNNISNSNNNCSNNNINVINSNSKNNELRIKSVSTVSTAVIVNTTVENVKKPSEVVGDSSTILSSLSSTNNLTNPNNNKKLEVSEIEKSIIEEIYRRPSSNTLKQVVVNNNNNINITKLNEFTQGASVIIPSTATKYVENSTNTSTKQSNTNSHRRQNRKEKLNDNQYKTSNHHHHHHQSNSSRPAVIILNDNNDKTNNDITFGFEINEKLLSGDDYFDDEGRSNESNDKCNDNNSDYFSISDSSMDLSGLNQNNNLVNQTQLPQEPCTVNVNVNLNSMKLDKLKKDIDVNRLNNEEFTSNPNTTTNINTSNMNSNKNEITKTNKKDDLQLETTVNYKNKKQNINSCLQIKFIQPEIGEITGYDHDKVVQFIGTMWEEFSFEANGPVQYYNEQ